MTDNLKKNINLIKKKLSSFECNPKYSFFFKILICALVFIPFNFAMASPEFEAIKILPTKEGGQSYTVTLQILALMTSFTFLPAFLMMMTSFARIVIVLSFMRQALGTMQTPSNQIIVALSLFLTMFIMGPVFDRIHSDAIQPYLDEKITFPQAFEKAAIPMRSYMLKQTRESDIALFLRVSGRNKAINTPDEIPFTILIPAYSISELKTAFQIGFLIFIPFLVIDLVVASTLMAMGMMMLSPMMISLPFKLMLFVMIDGWSLIIGTLTSSFYLGP